MQENMETIKDTGTANLAHAVSEEQNGENNESQTETAQHSDSEIKAMARGWKPKDQYNGDDWRPAKEFLDRGELLDTIKHLSKENREIKSTLENVNDHMTRWTQHVKEQTLRELRANKNEAIQSGDVESVEKIDAEIDRRRQEDLPKPAQAVKAIPPEVISFKERNGTWFNTDTSENIEMMQEAARIDQLIVSSNPDISPADALKKVEDHIKYKFPHRFGNPRRNQPRDVETGSETAGTKRRKYDAAKITDDMRRIAFDFVRRGSFKNVEAYYEQLAEMGELK